MNDKNFINQNQPRQRKSGLKKFWKAFGLMVGILILLAVLARFVISPAISVLKPLLVTPTKIKVTLSESEQGNEPFNLYIGNINVDGGGDYINLNKINETTWEANAPDNLGSKEDMDALIVLKAGESDLVVPDSQASVTKITPRIKGEKFQRGVEIVDYWSGDWGDQEISQTNSELKKSNIGWVYLAPFWDLQSSDSPQIENVEGGTTQYTEEQLRNHLNKLRKDGLEVMMAPGLCCTPQPANFDKPIEWWNQFFSQYEKFLLYHAKLAEETGVKILIFTIASQAWVSAATPPPDAEQRWQAIYEKVRSVYHGKLALSDYVCCGAVDEGVGEKLTWRVFQKNVPLLEKFDLLVVSLWNALSKTNYSSQEELYQNAALIIDDKIKHIFDKYNKPIILQTAYRSAEGTSQGLAKYSVDLVSPDWQEKVTVEAEFGGWKWSKSTKTAKAERPILIYDAREQAMIYEALLKAVAEREWIIGFYPFVYHMKGFDFPRQPDYDIRRKPAETILANWYSRF